MKTVTESAKNIANGHLIINFDQTLLSYICTGNRTYAKKGSSNVPLVGKEKKTNHRKFQNYYVHFFPCRLSIKDRPVVAFQKLSIFLLILMRHARSITEAMIPKQFNTYRKWCFRMSKKRKKNWIFLRIKRQCSYLMSLKGTLQRLLL